MTTYEKQLQRLTDYDAVQRHERNKNIWTIITIIVVFTVGVLIGILI